MPDGNAALPIVTNPPRVFVAVPAYGQLMMSLTTSSLIQTSRMLIQNNWDGGFGTLSYPDIVEVRNMFLSIWYDRIQSSHMLFIDADMGFEPALIHDMIRFAVNGNNPIVGSICPKKVLPIEFAGKAKLGDARVVDNHMEVDGVGGAIMLISREAVTSMLQKWPELSDTKSLKNHAARSIMEGQGCTRLIKAFNKVCVLDGKIVAPGEGEEFSEDLSFCQRWRECGGTVWANIMHDVTHVGLYEYRGRYYDHIKGHIHQPGDLPGLVQPVLTSGQSASAMPIPDLTGMPIPDLTGMPIPDLTGMPMPGVTA